MSIFDLYGENLLPGDRKKRVLKSNHSEYQYFGSEAEVEEKPAKAFWPFYLIAGLVLGILVAQLLNLQISHGSFNRILAEGNRIRQRQIVAPRGIIYDSKGKALVVNDASFCLAIYPLDLPRNKDERQKYYQKISQITQIPLEEILNVVSKKSLNRADPIVLKENLDRDTALLLQVKIANLPGLLIEKRPVRNYQEIPGLSQVMGYVGKVSDQELKKNNKYQMNEWIGKEGIEKSYQEFLKGKDGINQIEVDSQGRAQRMVSSLPPEPGDSLTLSLDSDLEKIMAETLMAELEAVDSKSGAAVAINPKTGGVLGMVSLPTYNNNIFSKGITSEEYQKLITNEDRPMFNRAISGNYPSGSTIKPMVASAGLQDGVITENTTIDDPGEIKVGSWSYPDWKNHGKVNVRKAIAESCNVFFYAVGGGWDKIKGLGVEKLRDYLEKYGFGKTLGIDLPGENSGLLPSPDWKKKNKKEAWYLGDTYHMSIGQGDVLATPLQMAVATASVANGGELLKPYVVEKIKNFNGEVVKETEKDVIRKGFIDESNMQIVREGMRQAVTAGSARSLQDLPVEAAAKTGTAQFGSEGKTHAWMIAFAPYDDPQIAIAIIVEGGGEGNLAAAPVVREIFANYFSR